MTDQALLKAKLGSFSASSMSRRSVLQGGAGAGLAAAGLLALGRRSAQAQDATPAGDGAPPLPAGATLLASGLLNPRFIATGDDGSLYVTEAGVGGDEPIMENPLAGEGGPPEATPAADAASPAAAEPAGSRGFTGQVTKIAPDGTVSVLATGLASYLFGFEPTGPAGITFANGMLWVAVGGSGPATATMDAIETENCVVSVDPATGEWTIVADIGAFERSDNPHPATVDSNLYGISAGPDGSVRVADAGGNAVYSVNPADGTFAVLAVLDDIPLPEGAQGPPTLQAVPTGIAENPAGGIFQGLLSGGPFPPGAAKVLTIAEDGTVADFATGLTMVTDVEIGPDGNVYACQISANFLAEIPEPGSVVRIAADGTSEIVADGIMLANGITFDAEGNLYVVAGAVGMGGPMGMVLRFDGIAAPA